MNVRKLNAVSKQFQGFRRRCTSGVLAKMEEVIVTLAGVKRAGEFSNSSPSPSKRKTTFVGISPCGKLTNVNTPTDRPFRVSIEGNIGAGKSTLIQYFSAMAGVETYPEPIAWWRNLDGHNLLDLMYSDTEKWLKVFQSYVQLTRFMIQTSPPKNPNTTVQMFERSVQNNRYCFLEQAYRNGNLHEADYFVIDQWYRWIRENEDINLDLIVYLRSTPEVVYERVKARGRPEECGITLNYLQCLHESHERWLMTYDERFNTIPVLVLNADQAIQDIQAEYKLHQDKILGHEKKGKPVLVETEEKDRVKKTLNF